MSSNLTSQKFRRAGALAFVAFVMLVAIIESRSGEDAAVLAPLEPTKADAPVRELARCRTVTPDDNLVLNACRRAWAENHRHFFDAMKSTRLPGSPAADASGTSMGTPQQEIDRGGTR